MEQSKGDQSRGIMRKGEVSGQNWVWTWPARFKSCGGLKKNQDVGGEERDVSRIVSTFWVWLGRTVLSSGREAEE